MFYFFFEIPLLIFTFSLDFISCLFSNSPTKLRHKSQWPTTQFIREVFYFPSTSVGSVGSVNIIMHFQQQSVSCKWTFDYRTCIMFIFITRYQVALSCCVCMKSQRKRSQIFYNLFCLFTKKFESVAFYRRLLSNSHCILQCSQPSSSCSLEAKKIKTKKYFSCTLFQINPP